MGGLGSRFKDVGFDTPKPLITVDGQAMFLKALSSLDTISCKKKFYFVIRQEHVTEQGLDTLIEQVLPEANVIIIPELTRGAVETAIAANSALDSTEPLVVMDCDLWFVSSSYTKMVMDSIEKRSDIAGGLLTFEANNPRYSYAVIDSDNIVRETAEKKVVSNHAITGAYFFSSAQKFTNAASILLNQEISAQMPEYYMSLLYNILINKGEKVEASYVDKFASFGTPDELTAYNQLGNLL